MKQKHSDHFVISLLLLLLLLIRCRSDVTVEHEHASPKNETDTLSISSFDVSRANSLRSADWKVYEAGDEVIIAPSDWTSHTDESGLNIMPPSTDSCERILFNRYNKDSPNLNYDMIAQKITNESFRTFKVLKRNSLEKVRLSQDYFYERKADLAKERIIYNGYCIVHVGNSFIYQYEITLAKSRTDLYKGDLIKDIVGNLQINHKYIMRNENPIRKIIYLKK